MKKIVALVLCLVLALSLCTVAFAADEYTLYGADGTSVAIGSLDKFERVPAKDPVYNADGTLKTAGNVAYFAATDTVNGTYYFIECAQADAESVLKAGTTVVAYLKDQSSDVATVQYAVKATKYTNIGTACGQLNVTDAATVDYVTYTYAKEAVVTSLGTAAGTVAAGNVLYDGEVLANAAILTDTLVAHLWTGNTKNAAGTKYITAKCVKCEAVGTVYAGKINVPAGVTAFPAAINAAGEYVGLAGTAGTTTVESAKTFDAGIALYAGMALASVAGSAVVIGKKKEF